MKSKVGVAVIGSGIGLSHLECLLRMQESGEDVSVVGIAKQSEDITAIRKKFSPDLLKDKQVYIGETRTLELINHPDVKLVIVATPDSLHYAYARAALDHGKNVLVEKPLTPDYSTGIKLLDMAKQNDVLLDTATQARVHGKDLLDLVSSNRDVAAVEISYILPSKNRPDIAHAIDNIFPHIISLVGGNSVLRSLKKDERGYSISLDIGALHPVHATVRIGYTDSQTTDRRITFYLQSGETHERVFRASLAQGVYSEQWLRLNGWHTNPREQLLRETVGKINDGAYKTQRYAAVEKEHHLLMAVKDAAKTAGVY
jgi:hypothetical protein